METEEYLDGDAVGAVKIKRVEGDEAKGNR